MVAVLPFVNVSGQPADAWIGDGIAETLLSDLERGGLVSVVGPGTLLAEAGAQGTALPEGDDRVAIEIGRRLGLAWLVRGGYQHANDQVRITARVIDVATGDVVGTAKVDGAISRIFELQDRIVTELGADLRGAQPAAAARAPVGEAPRPGSGAVVGAEGGGRPGRRSATGPPAGRGVSAPARALSTEDPPGKPSGAVSLALPPGYDGPPAPVAAASATRDAAGRVTMRAVRLTTPLRIDGALDEALYREVEPASDFIQIEPSDGQKAVNQTQVWLAFDDDNVYFSVNCFDNDMAHLVSTEMRRDNNLIFIGNDFVAFLIDSFYDKRNSLFLSFNPSGARLEGQVSNERVYLPDWNPVWSVKTQRRADGWSAEAAVPFKSIRYRPGKSQVWGFQVQRMKRSTNELSFLAHPPKARLMQAYQHVSMYPTLVGIEAPAQSVNVDVKPYVTANLLTDVKANPRISNDPGGDIGVDAKLGVTQNLSADLTYNTDFAQIEADDQQVNLTRFGLFFPEKRDFFLENQGTFNFGGINGGGFGVTAGSDAPILFYSRRIGLNGSRLIPIKGGGRLTGRIGKFELGALDMESGKDEVSATRATNFSVVRVKRDLLRKSGVGLIYAARSVALNGVGANQTYGADLSLAFFQNLNIDSYWARTATDGVTSGDQSYRSQLNYTGDRYGAQLEHLDVGERFNPEVGFVRRVDLRKEHGQFRFSPRPRSSKRVRKYTHQATVDFFRNHRGVTESRELEGETIIEFQNADRFRVDFQNTDEFLLGPFPIASGVTLPVGGYNYNTLHVGYQGGQQRRISGTIFMEYGTFYNGRKATLNVTRGRVNLTSKLSIEPNYALNRVTLMQGDFTTNLVGTRVTYAVTPLMFTNAFLQYSSTSGLVSANVRFRWEYRPGSELFVVFNEERDARATPFPALANRAFIVKVNRLLRF